MIDEAGTYPFNQLISNIGGAMGLFLGLNILVVLNWIENIYKKSTRMVSNAFRGIAMTKDAIVRERCKGSRIRTSIHHSPTRCDQNHSPKSHLHRICNKF